MAPSRAATHPTDGEPAASKPDCDTPTHGGTDLPTHVRGEPERHANINTDAHAGAHAEPDGDALSDANADARAVVHDNSGLETNSFSAWRTPTPLPVSDLIFYLHNNPTPPMGDTMSQATLPMDSELPTASVLYNYDSDRDASPGLVIAKGGSGPYESDPTKYQAWRTPVFSGAVVIQGDAMVKLWSAMKDFDDTKGGAVTVYLLDFDGWSYVELGSGAATIAG
jgi:hypothetical protein